jgi:hypothetical protein
MREVSDMAKNNKILCLSLRHYPDDYSSDHHHREERKGEMADAIETLKEQIKVIKEKVGNSTMPETMTDTRFLSAEGKKYILRQWKTFIKSGFNPGRFTETVYEHLHLHCGFIAHYDRSGFYYTYWNDEVIRFAAENGYETAPAPKVFYEWERFLRAVDIRGEYADINTAMMIVLEDELDALIKKLTNEAKDLYRHEVTHLRSCWERERKDIEDEINALKEEIGNKEIELHELTLEKYLEMTNSDYEDMFGDEIFSDLSEIQLSVA